MTEKKILFALKKAQQCGEHGHYMESLLRMYHLNISVLRYISGKLNVNELDSSMKPGEMVEKLVLEINLRPNLKSVITKKNLKSLRPWFTKMDVFLKTLKRKEPANSKTLLSESENVLAILKISATKIFISNSKN